MDTFYPTHLNANYTNDIEYRTFIQELFTMDHIPHLYTGIQQQQDGDSDYDDVAASIILDLIYNETNSLPDFNTLYVLAAATMISDDKSIGLAVLFSYTFANKFHECIISYIEDKSISITLLNEMISLLSDK
jgi:hypothetical protein